MPPAIQIPRGLLPSGLASPYWRAGAGDSLTTQIKDGATSQINDVLQTAGLSPSQVQTAVQAYTGLDAASTNCVLGLLQGDVKPSFVTLAPLIAAGLAAANVAAPIVAIVAAALPLLDTIADAIFAQPQETCTWKVGATCFNQKQPYGPADPKWIKADGFFQTCVPAGWQIDQNVGGPYSSTESPYSAFDEVWSHRGAAVIHSEDGCNTDQNTIIDGAYWFYRSTIDVDLRYIQQHYGSRPTGLWGFLYVYYQAWRANAEFALNGYKPIDDYVLLQAVVAAWNKVHQSTATYTFQALGPPSSRGCLNLYPKLLAHYPNLLINGDVDGQDKEPITINIGSRIAPAPPIPPKASTGAVVSYVAAGAAGASLLGVGAYALLTQQTYGAVLDKLARGLAKPFRR